MSDKAEVVGFSAPDGSSIAVEVVETKMRQGFQPIGRGDGKSITYQEAIDRVRPAADYLLKTIANLDAAPKSVEVSFGVKLSSKAGAIIASAAAEGNFSVTLCWERKE